eukprot:CAMPEP_0170568532 /NCGR_PEP_ID=MMETSP0211-20121228/81264_1 /TAXON_ID=311385 /ORGANISM="Pseudokeronopsis sp., Strain OXSARD2" /LENGTH=85 /DNA_ID=CAMNT_0010890463 /DNA_START=856 /DNA_END=1113 /DNA_ORIENTATION=-
MEMVRFQQDKEGLTSVFIYQSLKLSTSGGVYEIKETSRKSEYAVSTQKGLSFIRFTGVDNEEWEPLKEFYFDNQEIPSFVELLPD